MDRELVIKSLNETLPKIKEIGSKEIPNLSLAERLRYSKLTESYEIAKPLAQTLENQDEFGKSKNLYFNHGSGGSMIFTPEQAALFLCRQAEKVNCEAAVDYLIDIFNKTEANLLCVMALRGIKCDEEVKLTERIKMIPLSLLPPSSRKESFQNPNQTIRSFEHISAFTPFPENPKRLERAFLITPVKIKPVLVDPKNNDEEWATTSNNTNEALTHLDEVRLCLTAICLCSPLQECSWKQFEDEVLEDAANVSGGKSFPSLEIMPFRLRISEKINEESASSVIKIYFTLENKFRCRMVLALNRLNQAMRRATIGDKAVELSIALESLLLDSGKGDNRFKVSLRSGIVFSNDLSKRMECRNVIKKMYDIRSKLVHDGVDSNSDKDAGKTIEESINYSAAIMINLIKYGPPADWSELELSGRPFEMKDS